jgi:hypothetical protein
MSQVDNGNTTALIDWVTFLAIPRSLEFFGDTALMVFHLSCLLFNETYFEPWMLAGAHGMYIPQPPLPHPGEMTIRRWSWTRPIQPREIDKDIDSAHLNINNIPPIHNVHCRRQIKRTQTHLKTSSPCMNRLQV